MRKNSQKLVLTSLVSTLLFFIMGLIARPRLVLETNFMSIGVFSILSIPLLVLITLNIVKALKNKMGTLRIFDLLIPLLILIPLYLGITGFNSLISMVKFDVFLFIPFLFSLTFVISYGTTLFVLYQDYESRFKPIGDETTKQVNGFLNRLTDPEWPLSKFVIYLFVVAILFFVYPLFTEQFTIPLGGDYTQQQIPFYTNGYDDWWNFFKTGQLPLWDSNTFLGANNIGSNAFYYSVNPFFFPILLFSRDLIPQGIAVLMITKFVLAALTMRLYLKHMGVKENTARLFAFMFAFGGWTTYYLWFNHFMEVAIVFPLVFLGIEKIFKEKSPFLLIVSLGLMGLANYFFLVTTCFVGVIYAAFRYFQLIKTFKKSDHLKILSLGILGFALGILAGGLALFPGISVAMFSDRVTSATYLDQIKEALSNKDFEIAWKLITSWTYRNEQHIHKAYYPLISFFFPVLSDRSVSLLTPTSYDNTISSLFSYTPIILLLVPSFIHSIKMKKISHFVALGFFLFALFTPFFYNALHGFTNEYGRWQIFITFSLVTYTALNFDQRQQFKRSYFDFSFIVVCLLMAFAYFFAYNYQNKNGIGSLQEREYVVFYQFAIVLIVYLIYRYSYENKNLYRPLRVILTLEAIVMGTITMIGHGFISYTGSTSGGLKNYNNDVEVVRSIQALDGSYYRMNLSQSYKSNDNYAMRVGYNGLSAFHSLYNFELMEFNQWSRVNYNRNGWSLGLGEKRLFLNNFLNVKYYVETEAENRINFYQNKEIVDTITVARPNVPVTHEALGNYEENDRYVFADQDMFQFGFAVDNIMSHQRLNPLSDGTLTDIFAGSDIMTIVKNEEFYLQTGIVSLADFERLTELYPHLEAKNYSTMPTFYKELSTGSSQLNKRIVKTFYSCPINAYPYKNPTASNLASNCIASDRAGVLEQGDAIEFTLADDSFILPEGGYLMLNWTPSSAVRVFLYDENNEVITFDDVYNSSSDNYFKLLRGMHSTVPVKKLTVVPLGRQSVQNSSFIFTYTPTQIDTLMDKTKEYPLENVKVGTNKITFSTNYAEEKFIVTTIPYDKGWNARTLKSDKSGKGIEVFKTHGGFVGLMSEKGQSDYELSFVPQYFIEGTIASFTGFYIGIFGMVVAYRKKRIKDKTL